MEVLTVISYIYVVLRMRHKKRMRQAITDVNSPGYRGNPPAYAGNVPIYVEPPSPISSPYFDNKRQERQASQPYED